MTLLYQQILGIILTIFVINLKGQDGLIIVIGEVESIEFDRSAFEQRKFEDSLAVANETWSRDTLENGTVVSTRPSVPMRMTNPYNLRVNIKKSFSTTVQSEQINVSIWEHENPELFLSTEKPYAFLLASHDSNGIYPTYDYYRVFRTRTGKWAEPVTNRDKKYPEAKKAVFNYELLKVSKTQYYQLISDELDCCEDQLRTLYGIKKEK